MTKTQLVCRYVRECITDVAWWSSARRGGSARRTVPRDCPGLWRLMVFLFLFFFGLLGCLIWAVIWT
ncbi:hypothetical protein V6Z12_A07G035800 [Gossypium hirsutum]